MALETTAAKILAFPGENPAEVRQQHGLTSPPTDRMDSEKAAAGPERDRHVKRPKQGVTNDELRDLHRNHFAGLLAYFVRRGFDREEAEDLVSDTFVAAVGSRSSFRGEAKASTWLYGIADKVAGKRLRALSTQKRTANLVRVETWEDIQVAGHDEPSLGGDPFQIVSTKERRALVLESVARLASPYRECLQMRLLGGHAYSVIAEALGRTVPQVSTYVHQAKKKLRRLLRHEGAPR